MSMRCYQCHAPTRIVDSRYVAEKGTTRRRYRCANGHRFSTVEEVMELKRGVAAKPSETAAQLMTARYKQRLYDLLLDAAPPQVEQRSKRVRKV